MNERVYLRSVAALLILLAIGFPLKRHLWRAETALPPDQRPAAWAQPLSLQGVGNLHRVSPALYRGEQPTEEGIRELHKLGVRTIVNLRSFHSDREALGTTPVGYDHITMKAWHPEDKEVLRFLRIVGDPAKTPVFVHCQHGADRTGTMCAAYRIAVEGWPREEAIREMTLGGFGFHSTWTNLVAYLRALDLDAIRQAAADGGSAP